MEPKDMADLIRQTEEQFFETIERKRQERELKEAAAAEAAKAAVEAVSCNFSNYPYSLGKTPESPFWNYSSIL